MADQPQQIQIDKLTDLQLGRLLAEQLKLFNQSAQNVIALEAEQTRREALVKVETPVSP